MAIEHTLICPYHRHYADDIRALFHLSVRSIVHPRYSEQQLSAWSAAPRSAKHWHLRLTRSKAWLLLNRVDQFSSWQCIGFINVETHFSQRGYIDSLYIHPRWQRQGYALQLYRHLAMWARGQGYSHLSVDASYLSKDFFAKQGFVQVQRSYQRKLGQHIPGFYMTKHLD